MSISFNHIPSNIRVPLFYAEVDNSMANTATAAKKALLIGQKTDGTATDGKPTLISSQSQAMTKFGRGAPLTLAVTAFKDQNTSTELWCLPMTVTGTPATGAVELKGIATESGTIAFYVGATKVPVTVASGTLAANIATDLINAINANKDLPITASTSTTDTENSTAIKLTAKTVGSYGNDILLATNRQGATGGEEDIAGISLTITAMSGGTGEIDYAKAFKAVETETFWFIGCPDSSSTALDAYKKEMQDSTGRWAYSRMQFGHIFTAKRGDAESLVTFGKTRNDQHVSLFGIEENNPNLTLEVVGAILGRAASYYTNDPARPLQTGPLEGLLAPSIEDRFGFNEQNTLLSNGIATLYQQSGTVMIQRAITTYQFNSFGDADNSYLDSTILYTLAEIISRLKTAITSKYPRHKLANDGTRYGAGQAIVTPSVIKSELIAQYQKMEEEGLVENADLFAKYLIVERDANDVNRINVLLPPDLVNQLRIFALQAQFRLQYSSTD